VKGLSDRPGEHHPCYRSIPDKYRETSLALARATPVAARPGPLPEAAYRSMRHPDPAGALGHHQAARASNYFCKQHPRILRHVSSKDLQQCGEPHAAAERRASRCAESIGARSRVGARIEVSYPLEGQARLQSHQLCRLGPSCLPALQDWC
jgi:hypothetical protein